MRPAPDSAMPRGPAWFERLAVELERRTGSGHLSDREHSYAAERLFQDYWPRSVAQEIHAVRLGFDGDEGR